MNKKLLKRKLTQEMTYSEMLQSYAVIDLKDMAKAWGIKNLSKLKKEDLVKVLAEKVETKIDEALYAFNLDHYTIISSLAKGNNLFSQFPIAAGDLINLGLILEGSVDGETQVIMPSFIYNAMGTYYGEHHESLTFNTILKDYMELSTTLYGVMEESFFVNSFYEFNEQAIDKVIIEKALTYTAERTKNTIRENGYLHYYRLGEYEKVHKDIATKEDVEYQVIDHALLQKFVQNNNSFWTETHQKLEGLLVSKFNGDADLMIDTMDELAVMLSYNHGISDFIQLFSKKHTETEVFHLKEFADYIMTINNEMPHWELKGHAPMDFSQYKKQMPIVKGEKIHRNDPCPCGSGKKYKKCCLNK